MICTKCIILSIKKKSLSKVYAIAYCNEKDGSKDEFFIDSEHFNGNIIQCLKGAMYLHIPVVVSNEVITILNFVWVKDLVKKTWYRLESSVKIKYYFKKDVDAEKRDKRTRSKD